HDAEDNGNLTEQHVRSLHWSTSHHCTGTCRSVEDQGERAGRSKTVMAGIQAQKARLLAVAKTIKTPHARARRGVMR
ncbi:hypothetical protein, partial [Achromobacter xylosoxidans]|uniref:hypothetical protein n=1 Tax=Alcaligenes xylosoxydans xylosoxydans TaxID=85698 RepID=UPI001A94A21E